MTLPIVDAEDAIRVLNRIHQADPTVLPALIAHRIPCNEKVVEDVTVQVGRIDGTQNYEVGFLGILNGIFGIRSDGWGYITAIINDKGEVTGFARTSRKNDA